jgi:hypothetical protein
VYAVIEFVLTVSAMLIGLIVFGLSSAALLKATMGFMPDALVWFIALLGAGWLAFVTRRTVRRRFGIDKPSQ